MYPVFRAWISPPLAAHCRFEEKSKGVSPRTRWSATFGRRVEDDHGARSYPAVPKSGVFELELAGLRDQTYHLKLVVLYANGATESRQMNIEFDVDGKPDSAALNANWIVDRAEQAVITGDARADEMLPRRSNRERPTLESKRKLRLLQAVLHPPQPINLATVRDNDVFISDVIWKDAKVGWGKPARNHYWFDDQIRDAVLLNVGGQFYEKGLYAHSPARYVFAVDEKWKTFSATIGLQDGAGTQGSASSPCEAMDASFIDRGCSGWRPREGEGRFDPGQPTRTRHRGRRRTSTQFLGRLGRTAAATLVGSSI